MNDKLPVYNTTPKDTLKRLEWLEKQLERTVNHLEKTIEKLGEHEDRIDELERLKKDKYNVPNSERLFF